MDDFDRHNVDEIVLALMQLTLHDYYRAWKGFDWDTLDRLYEKGWIADPKNKAKSVVLTEEGLAESARLFQHYLGDQAKHKIRYRFILYRRTCQHTRN